ncbi:hypothetical protein [Rhodonellum sp.]|uniref:hypothetical protein n=1 Tax=Rhodonellum sp. TaxID=2231180 RepID=UPI002726EF52|nr:hypothetical protein [Rhodonellum sp.]MDO9550897.1 hypothetical protein [Rhodonellum sp.]
MGFIPIFITLGGAVMLFMMVVNMTLKTKKNQVLNLQAKVLEELQKIGEQGKMDLKLDPNDTTALKAVYIQVKNNLGEKDKAIFEKEIKKPFQTAKLIKSQYNELLKRKPYSIVAKLLGYNAI